MVSRRICRAYDCTRAADSGRLTASPEGSLKAVSIGLFANLITWPPAIRRPRVCYGIRCLRC